MSATSSSEPNPAYTGSKRESTWALLDKRPRTSEINSYTSEEIGEIRHLTEHYLDLISKRSGTKAALNKESQAFLDAISVVRGLSRIAENKFEQGAFDDAARSVVNAIRWQRFADDLYLSGGVTLSRTNSTRLWYLLTEIYVRMGEQDLALKTMRKAGASMGDETDPTLSALIPIPVETDGYTAPEIPIPISHGRSLARYSPHRNIFSAVILGAVIIGVLVFVSLRAQVAAKSMIDHSSVGIDYLNIAYLQSGQDPNVEALILATDEFSALRAKLDGWSWAIAVSSILPPAHDQFVAMDRLASLGSRIVAAPYSSNINSRLYEENASLRICESADQLSTIDGNLLAQLEKNRNQMLTFVSAASDGLCGSR